MNVFGAFRGTYIAAAEFDGKRPTLTIAGVKVVQLEDEKGAVKGKPVVFFKEVKRGWVLNKTTASCLAEMFSTETDAWIGKRVTLYSAIVSIGGERKPGIRVLGSPDISKPIAFDLKLPRKKPIRMTLKPTPKGEIVVPEEPVEVPEEAQPESAPEPEGLPT